MDLFFASTNSLCGCQCARYENNQAILLQVNNYYNGG